MRILLAAALLLASTAAFADEPQEQPAQGNPEDCARARKLHQTCELTIGAEEVEGGVTKPDGIAFSPRDYAFMRSLIHIRRDYIPQILKTAEDL